jgi:hypothetical protein
MAVKKFNGETGITQLIQLIKSTFVRKEYKTGSSTNYKELTDNNLTDELKKNLETAYSHSQEAHAPADAEKNVIDTVKVNGEILTVSDKAVDVPVPLISTDITADASTDLKSVSPKAVKTYVTDAIAGITGMNFKVLASGEYDASTGIPTITGEAGYIYLVPISGTANNAYDEYIYINNSFEKIGSTDIDLSDYLKTSDVTEYTAAEIQSIWTAVFSA